MKKKALKSEKGTKAVKKSNLPRRPHREAPKRPIRILLADSHRILREGLVRMFEAEEGMAVIAEANDSDKVVEMVTELNPDVVIIEPGLPGGRGIETVKEIHVQSPTTRIVALSTCTDRLSVLGIMRAGCSGYLLKDCSFKELTNGVRAVASGQNYLSPGITRLVVDEYVCRMSGSPPSESSKLTTRERDVLRLIAEGRRTKEIAKSLHLSIKTVESHRRQMMEKLNLSSIAALVKYAIREGLTSL
jgi:two-component system, NarL family, response regulator NreC